jgi:hypothetical protein
VSKGEMLDEKTRVHKSHETVSLKKPNELIIRNGENM